MLPRLFSCIFPLVALLTVFPAAALELEVLSPTMTRQDADDYLTKDYTYRVLEDGSVRRAWNPDANSRLLLDFDPKKGTLLSMVMEFRKPVEEEAGMKLLTTMTGKKKISWAKVPEDKKEKIGVAGARAVKVGKGFAFYEEASNGKCRRITVYPNAPKESRLLLREMAVDDAMGSSFATSQSVTDSRKLMEEESKIFFTPNKAELAKAAAAARKRAEDAGDDAAPIAVNTVKAEEPTEETPEDPIIDTPEEKPEKAVASTAKKKKKKVKEKSFAEQLGLTEDAMMMYGGALLVLLIIIVVAVRSKINSDIRKNREKSIRLGTSTSADMLGSPQRRRTPRRR